MTSRQNLAAAGASFALAALLAGGGIAVPALASEARERDASGTSTSGAMQGMAGGMHHMQEDEAIHAEMHELCHRMMVGDDDGRRR